MRNLPLPTTGIPHLQFNAPEEWREVFRKQGFKIVAHDMTIGFFVNDCWHGFYALMSREFLEPVIMELAPLFGKKYVPLSLEERFFYPGWLMKRVNLVDEWLKPVLKHRWGWNLFVLSRDDETGPIDGKTAAESQKGGNPG